MSVKPNTLQLHSILDSEEAGRGKSTGLSSAAIPVPQMERPSHRPSVIPAQPVLDYSELSDGQSVKSC